MDINVKQQQEHAGGEQVSAVQDAAVRPYKLRKLQAKDITPMAKIIGRIGIDELISCYGDDDFTELMVKLKNRKSVVDRATGAGTVPEGNVIHLEDAKAGKDNSEFIVGVAVAARIANQVLLNLDRCSEEVYGLLGSLSGMSVAEIAGLELDVFIQMIAEVIRENNVVNFIRAAIKLLN